MSTSVTIPTPNPTSVAWNVYLDAQSFNLTALDNSTATFSLSDVNAIIYYYLAQTAVQGFIIGFSALLIIVLILLTPAKKARRLIFIFNFLSLLFICIRSILNVGGTCSQVTYGVGETLLGAIAQYSLTHTIVGAVISFLLTITIVVSLVLQVRVVFAAEPRTQKIVTALLSLCALWIVGLYLRFTVWEITLYVTRNFVAEPWTYNGFEISMIIYIGICCLLFLYKLFHAIQLRKRMGYRNFGPLQILFIMFAQCLVIPCNIPVTHFVNL